MLSHVGRHFYRERFQKLKVFSCDKRRSRDILQITAEGSLKEDNMLIVKLGFEGGREICIIPVTLSWAPSHMQAIFQSHSYSGVNKKSITELFLTWRYRRNIGCHSLSLVYNFTTQILENQPMGLQKPK